jgi:hypothetical protein
VNEGLYKLPLGVVSENIHFECAHGLALAMHHAAHSLGGLSAEGMFAALLAYQSRNLLYEHVLAFNDKYLRNML